MMSVVQSLAVKAFAAKASAALTCSASVLMGYTIATGFVEV